MTRVRQELANITWQEFGAMVMIPLVAATPFWMALLITGN